MVVDTLNKRIAGAEAHRAGQSFEDLFAYACRRLGIVATRVPDGCRQLRGQKLIRVKSPFDWIVSCSPDIPPGWAQPPPPKVLLCDTKSTIAPTFPYSKIDQHQLEQLRGHERNGILAGYVVEFRASRDVVFFPALTLASCEGRRGSLSPAEGIHLGSSEAFNVGKLLKPQHRPADSHLPGRTPPT